MGAIPHSSGERVKFPIIFRARCVLSPCSGKKPCGLLNGRNILCLGGKYEISHDFRAPGVMSRYSGEKAPLPAPSRYIAC
jgi:hypothetical protein